MVIGYDWFIWFGYIIDSNENDNIMVMTKIDSIILYICWLIVIIGYMEIILWIG